MHTSPLNEIWWSQNSWRRHFVGRRDQVLVSITGGWLIRMGGRDLSRRIGSGRHLFFRPRMKHFPYIGDSFRATANPETIPGQKSGSGKSIVQTGDGEYWERTFPVIPASQDLATAFSLTTSAFAVMRFLS